jgi:hypothetical protein
MMARQEAIRRAEWIEKKLLVDCMFSTFETVGSAAAITCSMTKPEITTRDSVFHIFTIFLKVVWIVWVVQWSIRMKLAEKSGKRFEIKREAVAWGSGVINFWLLGSYEYQKRLQMFKCIDDRKRKKIRKDQWSLNEVKGWETLSKIFAWREERKSWFSSDFTIFASSIGTSWLKDVCLLWVEMWVFQLNRFSIESFDLVKLPDSIKVWY